MKKMNYLLVLVLALFCITGCGNSIKKLTCTQSEEQSGMKMSQEMIVEYENDKPTNIVMTATMEATDDAVKEQWEEVAEELEGMFDYFNDEDGMKSETKVDNDKYKVTAIITIDLEKVDKEVLADKFDLDDDFTGLTFDEAKKDAESDGATCK